MSDQIPTSRSKRGPGLLSRPPLPRSDVPRARTLRGSSKTTRLGSSMERMTHLLTSTKCSHGATWYVHDTPSGSCIVLFGGPACAADRYFREQFSTSSMHMKRNAKTLCIRKPSAAVCILRCGSDSIDYLVLGDASILLESSDEVIHVTDRRMHRIGKDIRNAILDRLRKDMVTTTPMRPALFKNSLSKNSWHEIRLPAIPSRPTIRRRHLIPVQQAVPLKSSELVLNEPLYFPTAPSGRSQHSACIRAGVNF